MQKIELDAQPGLQSAADSALIQLDKTLVADGIVVLHLLFSS